jgi:transmembrane sensor
MSEEQPGKQEGIDDPLLNEAVEYLQSLRLQERPIEPAQLRQAVSRLLVNIRQAEKSALRITLYRRLTAAAVLLLVVAAGFYGGRRWLSPKATLQTAYGEIRNNKLPDGTEVMANADTRILYSTGWKDGKDREVWLKGEAFFHVSKTPLKSRFIVHTDHFDILVTGTKFNAVNRSDKANISLEEGSVTLLAPDQKELKMLPGDFVEYRSGLLEKRLVQRDSVLAWKEHILIFNNTPLWQLVDIIREYYGVTVQPADEATGNKTLVGILRNDNLDALLRALEMTGDFKVERNNDKIVIKNH